MLIDCGVPITSKDHPGLLSAVFYTDLSRCNLNCHKCHNRYHSSGKLQNFLNIEEFRSKLQFLKTLTVKMIIISGGEPLYTDKTQELIPYLLMAKEFGFLVRIDTNGQYPQTMESLVSYIDGFAMDIKIPIIVPPDTDPYDDRYKRILYSTSEVPDEYLDNYRKNITLSVRYLQTLRDYSLLRTVKYPLLREQDISLIKAFADQYNLRHYLNPFVEL